MVTFIVYCFLVNGVTFQESNNNCQEPISRLNMSPDIIRSFFFRNISLDNILLGLSESTQHCGQPEQHSGFPKLAQVAHCKPNSCVGSFQPATCNLQNNKLRLVSTLGSQLPASLGHFPRKFLKVQGGSIEEENIKLVD